MTRPVWAVALLVSASASAAVVAPLVDPWTAPASVPGSPRRGDAVRSVGPVVRGASTAGAANAAGRAGRQLARSTLGKMPASGLGGTASAESAVVKVLENGEVVGLGALLADGRVLTSLSVIGAGYGLAVQSSQGATVPASVAHTHRGWDLALLVPRARLDSGLLLLEEMGEVGIDHGVLYVPVVPADAPGPEAPKFWSLAVSEPSIAYGADETEIPDARLPREPLARLGTPVIDRDALLAGLVVRSCESKLGRPCAGVRQAVLPPALLGKFLRQVVAAVPAAPELSLGPPQRPISGL